MTSGGENIRCAKKQKKRKFSEPFKQFIDKLRQHDKFNHLGKMGFDVGRGSYSIKALNKLTDWLQNPWWHDNTDAIGRVDEEAAIRQCYPDVDKILQQTQKLHPAPRTYNDVVDGALRQMRMIINRCIDELGATPTEIILESSRELGAGAKKRNEWEKFTANNQKKNKGAREEIETHGHIGTQTAVLRYQSWKEQECACPYCADKLSLKAALDGSQSDLDHILPKSLTQVGRKRSELVLVHKTCNDKKGKRTPWEAFGQDKARWAQIKGHAKRFAELGKSDQKNKSDQKDKPLRFAYSRKAKLLLLKDFEHEVLTDESIADFTDRQFQQTSWIAKKANQWLRSICPDVFVSKGKMTGMLRGVWQLNTVIPEVRLTEGCRIFDENGKEITREEFARYRPQWEGARHLRKDQKINRLIGKRIDHRHHLIDAFVISLTSRSLFQQIANRYRDYHENQAAIDDGSQGHHPQNRYSIPDIARKNHPIERLRESALALVRTPNLTHKPDRHPSGRFFQDTAYQIVEWKPGDKRLAGKKTLFKLAGNSIDETLKNLDTIVSDEVREIVQRAFDKRIVEQKKIQNSTEQAIKAALSKPIDYPKYKTKIWRVRCLQKIGRGYVKAENAIIIEHQSRHAKHKKTLLGDGYACLEITTQNGKWQKSRLISMADFRPHPVASGATRFFKGDTVEYHNKRYLIHMLKAQSEGSINMAPITEARLFAKLKKQDGAIIISGKNLAKLQLVE